MTDARWDTEYLGGTSDVIVSASYGLLISCAAATNSEACRGFRGEQGCKHCTAGLCQNRSLNVHRVLLLRHLDIVRSLSLDATVDLISADRQCFPSNTLEHSTD